MKKVIAVLIVLVAFTGSSWAEILDVQSLDVNVQDVSGYLIQRELGNSIGFRTKDGLTVLYLGTFRAKQPEPLPESPDAELKPDDGIFSVFMVKSDKDATLKLDVLEGMEIHTNRFSHRSGDWGYVADLMVNGNTRDIPGGFWVRVTFWHVLPLKYGERPLIARLGFVINGHEITIKRFRPGTWGDWLYSEREFAVPLEEDRKRVEFEEFEVRPEK